MYANTALFRADCSAARVYYAVRALDKRGCGFVWTDLARLHRLTGFAAGTLCRLLRGSAAAGWLQVVELRGNAVFVKYRSEAKILALLPKDWHCRHVQRLQNLKSKVLSLGHAILAKQVQLQRLHELKLRYSINAGKRKAKEIIGFGYVDGLRRRWKLPQTGRSCPAGTLPGLRYLAAVNLTDIAGGGYSTGVSQRTVAQALGLSQTTVSAYLKQFAHLRVQVFAGASLQDVINGGSFLYNGKETKRLTYVYRDVVSTQRVKEAKLLSMLPLRLTPQQLKIAKLAAILKGYPYSVRGAIKLIGDIGLDRFLDNIRLLSQTKAPDYRTAHLRRKRKLSKIALVGQSG